MPATLLKTKLYIPPAPFKLVPRPRLTELLNKATSPPRRLALLSAPAGFGKTTLLSEWISQTRQRVAWISLDKGDNDLTRFLAYLIAALEKTQASLEQDTTALLGSPQLPPLEFILTPLINEIASLPFDLTLILDDFHVIETTPVNTAVTFLLDHSPHQLHSIIATRSDPAFPLARLRARGELTEIRADDLRLTVDESAVFLNRVMGLHLPQEDIAALESRTEGWIAGLQLAALSIRGHDDVRQFVQSFTSGHRYILDYLIEEVFHRESAELQDFMLKISILDQFTGRLCDAVTERTDSDSLLESLEQSNLFIVPLDEQRKWFRYHHLFAELLRHRLKAVQAQDVAPLHERACAWYAANGFSVDAVQHALAGSDWNRAAELILGISEEMMKHGEIVTLLNWLEALPVDLVRTHPQLCLTYSWALILTGKLDAAEAYLSQAEEMSHDTAEQLAEIFTAQAQIARSRGDNRHTIELSQRALSLLPPEAYAQRSGVGVNLGIAYCGSGHLNEAEQTLTETESAARQAGNHYVRLIALTFLGVIQAARGKFRRAAEYYRQAIRSAGNSPAVALAHIQYGALLCEWNELDAAADHLQRGLELGGRVGNVEVQIGGYRTLAHLKLVQGNVSAARDVIEKAHQFARDHHLSPIMEASVAATHVQIALAQNDLPTAVHWADQVTQAADASPFYPLLGLARARVLLAQKETQAAADELAKCYDTVCRVGWEHAQIAVRVLQVLAAGTSQAGLGFLREALERAQAEGFIRVFADAGEALIPLLQDAALQGTTPEYVGRIVAAIRKPSEPLAETASLVEPLSEREVQVLRLMAAGLSNRAIAGKLVVTLGTAKTHVHNIFSKLDVSSRTQAIDRARELKII